MKKTSTFISHSPCTNHLTQTSPLKPNIDRAIDELQLSSKIIKYVYSPGRVNLIGEHIDYNGYGVAPIAIDRHFLAAVVKTPMMDDKYPRISFHHATDPKNYPKVTFTLGIGANDPVNMKYAIGWGSYLRAAIFDLLNEYKYQEKVDFDIFIDSNIPIASGVSSSSALVVCAHLAMLEKDEPMFKISQKCANLERHVGTASGGMDQAAICLSESGCANHITFRPDFYHSIFNLPKHLSFIVVNSGVISAKKETAPYHYNKRVFECMIGTYCILHFLIMTGYITVKGRGGGRGTVLDLVDYEDSGVFKNRELPFTLADVEYMLEEEHPDMDGNDKILNIISTIEPGAPCPALLLPRSKADILECLGVNQDFFQALLAYVGPDVWEMNDEFNIYNRLIHVLRESSRVDDFVEKCRMDDEKLFTGDIYKTLGKLANSSHRSCDEFYQCSCPPLNDLCRMARSFDGVYGARLTGAGWGGCIVCFCHEDYVGDIEEKFYMARDDGYIQFTDLFHFPPSGGASVLIV